MDIPSISAVIAATSVVVGVILAVLQLRNVVRTRKTGLIIELNPSLRLSATELQDASFKILDMQFKDYEHFVEKYGSFLSGKPVPRAIGTVASYFEGVAFLLHRELIDIGIVDYLVGEGVQMFWEKVKPLVEGIRKELDVPSYFQWFEWLYDETKERYGQEAT